MLYNGRRPGIKDDIGFQQGSNVKLNAPKRLSNFIKEKAPMVQDNEGYVLPTGYPKHKSLIPCVCPQHIWQLLFLIC